MNEARVISALFIRLNSFLLYVLSLLGGQFCFLQRVPGIVGIA